MNTKRKKTGRRVLSFLLTLTMVIGMMPGMGLTAYAEEKSVTFTSNGTQDGITVSAKLYARNNFFANNTRNVTISSGSGNITKLEITDSAMYTGRFTESHIVVTPGTKSIQGSILTVTDINAKSVTLSATDGYYWTANKIVVYYAPAVNVTGVTLDKTTATLTAGGSPVSLTATVSPSDATDKTVKWSVGGVDAGAVKLYTDEACTTEVGMAATETLTVYAKGISAGEATVTATSNVDSTKSASCAVTINKANAVAATVTANNRTYDGTDKPLVTVDDSTLAGGTMQYALGTATEATQPYTASIPTATDAGTYYVWYKAKGDGSHTDSSPVCLTVKIKEVHTHKFEHFEEKDSTYTESGYKAHYECTECGMWAEDANGVHIYTEEEKQKLIIPPKTRPSDSDSDTDNSDGSNMGSRDSRDSSSGKSSSTSAEVQSMIDQINTTSSVAIPENHQVETGVAASDVGGNWDHQVNADNWTYTKSDGTLAKSEWMSLDYNGLRYWYYFNDDGNMQTNWFDYNNERFYLMPEKDGWRGRMATGWKNIENKWYYFETVPGSSQGRLYRSSVTPDGHTVGADGAWNGVGETPVGQK